MGSGCSRSSSHEGNDGVPDKPVDLAKADGNGFAAPAPKGLPKTLKVIIAGAPASGKGTQCELIVERFGLVHLSTGDLLREEVKNATTAGLRAKDFMDRGDLVPDEVIINMVKSRLSKPDVAEKGWLLDGFPRAASQADALREANVEPDVFLLLNVPDDHIVERVVGRRLDPETQKIYHMKFAPPPPEIANRLVHRSDDTEDKCRNRLKVYHDNVNSVRSKYASVLREVDGSRDKLDVYKDVEKILSAFKTPIAKPKPISVQVVASDSSAGSPATQKAGKDKSSVTPKQLPIKVIIAGAPASGKGTQCELIVERYKLVHLSTGDLLREEVKNGTPAGNKAKEFMDRGDLVPDEVIVSMVKNRLAQSDCQTKGWLLDGFPRAESQAAALEKANIRPDVFILLNVPDSAIVERVVGRRLDPVTGKIYHVKFEPPPAEITSRLVHRSDDTEEKCRNRLKIYHDNVNSVRSVYTSIITTVDGNRDKFDVFGDVSSILDVHSKLVKHSAMRRAAQPLKVILCGGPASGKGTQSAMLVQQYGFMHLSTGDILRAEVAAESEIGKLAKDFMDRGDLVPDQVIVKMVRKRLNEPDAKKKGWLLDGFPRTASQALALDANGIRPHVFLLLDVDEDALVERVVGRRHDPVTHKMYHLKFHPPPPEALSRLEQRTDDADEPTRQRLKVYYQNLPSIRSKYESCLKLVNGNESKETVFADICVILDALKNSLAAAGTVSHKPRKAPLRVVLSGAPASGKGTQCDRIVGEFQLIHISAGDLLRLEVASQSDVGKLAQEYMDRGDLVPDEVIIKIVTMRLSQPDCKEHGFLLDGFPLSNSQAVAIDSAGVRPHCYISLNVPDKELKTRALNRRVDPVYKKVYNLVTSPPPADIIDRLITRSDDTEETVDNRLKQYNKYADVIKAHYNDVLVDIDGTFQPSTIFGIIRTQLHTIQSKLEVPLQLGAGTGPLRVLIAGAPASGKGTQCVLISDRFGVLHFSAGDLLRDEVKRGTMVGRRAKSFIDNGDLVPDDTVVAIIRNRLNRDDAKEKGWLLDGFPLNAAQAAALALAGIEPEIFIELQVPDDVLTKRVVGRRVDPETNRTYHMQFQPPPPDIIDRLIQRPEDSEEKVAERLRKHHEHMEAVRGKYKHIQVPIDADREPIDIFEDISGILEDLRPDQFD